MDINSAISFFAGLAQDISQGIPLVVPWVSHKFNKNNLSPAGAIGAAMLENEIFPFNKDVLYVNGSIHARDMGSFSMGKAMGGILLRAGITEHSITKPDELASDNALLGNIVTAGSPNSNEIAYTIYGNQYIPGEKTDFLNIDAKHPFELPIKFISDLSTMQARKYRISRGGGGFEADWALQIEGKASLWWPAREKIKTGVYWLEEDALIISKLPTVFDPEWKKGDRSIFSISGLHGPGTQGFKLLTEDHSAVEQLKQALRKENSTYWQALIPVMGITREQKDGAIRDIANKIDTQGIKIYPIRIDGKEDHIDHFNWKEKLAAIRAHKKSFK